MIKLFAYFLTFMISIISFTKPTFSTSTDIEDLLIPDISSMKIENELFKRLVCRTYAVAAIVCCTMEWKKKRVKKQMFN